MRTKEIINQEIKDLDKIIENGNSLLKQFPKDKLIPLSIQQARNRKKILIKERNKNNSGLVKNFLVKLYLFAVSFFRKNNRKKTFSGNQQKLPVS